MERQPGPVRAYRLAFAILTFVAIIYQFVSRAALGSFSPVNFFSFFTIQSNILAAIVLLLTGLRARGRSAIARPGSRSRRGGRLHDDHFRRLWPPADRL